MGDRILSLGARGVLGGVLTPHFQAVLGGVEAGLGGGEAPEIREATAPPSETICSHLPRSLVSLRFVLLQWLSRGGLRDTGSNPDCLTLGKLIPQFPHLKDGDDNSYLQSGLRIKDDTGKCVAESHGSLSVHCRWVFLGSWVPVESSPPGYAKLFALLCLWFPACELPSLPPLSSTTAQDQPGTPIHSTQTPALLFIVYPNWPRVVRAGKVSSHPIPSWLQFPLSGLLLLGPLELQGFMSVLALVCKVWVTSSFPL